MIESLKALLDYDPLTGIFTWRERRGRAQAGDAAGSVRPDGYLAITLGERKYLAHRLAWFYVHGVWPEEVDHVDGNPLNNALPNLRAATRSENLQNQTRPHSHNTSGFLGVWFSKEKNRFAARITLNKKRKHLGYFDRAEDAHAAYLKAKAELHPFSTLAA